ASLERIEAEVARTNGPLPEVRPLAPKPATPPLGWSALFSPAHVRPTLSLCAIWFFQTIGFYGFMSWVPTLRARQGLEMVHILNYIPLINLGALPGPLFAVFLSERWERKYSIVGVSLAIALFGLLYGLRLTPGASVVFRLL